MNNHLNPFKASNRLVRHFENKIFKRDIYNYNPAKIPPADMLDWNINVKW